MSDEMMPATASGLDVVYARIYESGRQRGLSECPCGRGDAGADLLDYDDGIEDGHRFGQRQGALVALLAMAGLGLVALMLRRRV